MAELSDDAAAEIGVAAFVVFTQSRDNVGRHFGSGRFPTTEAYLKTVDRLSDVAERFVGVEVIHGDGIELLASERLTDRA